MVANEQDLNRWRRGGRCSSRGSDPCMELQKSTYCVQMPAWTWAELKLQRSLRPDHTEARMRNQVSSSHSKAKRVRTARSYAFNREMTGTYVSGPQGISIFFSLYICKRTLPCGQRQDNPMWSGLDLSCLLALTWTYRKPSFSTGISSLTQLFF